MIKRNIKMRVTPEESKQVQEICFANGIFFTIAHDKISYTEAEYLFIEHDRISYRNYSNHNTGDVTKGYTEVNASFFIRTLGTCVEDTPEEELKQNINKEEIMEKNEVKSYANAKEYLIAKGLYEEVLTFNLDFEGYSKYFGNMFWFAETPQGFDFWRQIELELTNLEINNKLDEILIDYEIRKLEVTVPTQKPKQYLCYVQGKSLPKHIHKTLEQAKQEAQRLCIKELAKVSVLEVVAEFEAEVLVKEVL